MSVLTKRDYFGPESLAIASEAFSASWGFIERDPMFESYDREKLQGELARVILEMLDTGECTFLHFANRAIRRLREQPPEKQTRIIAD